MAKNIIPANPQGLMALMDNLLNGNTLAAGQPYEFAAPLVNDLTTARADLETKHLAVIASEGAKELRVGESNALKVEALDTIARVRAWLFARLPEGRNDERLQDYLLDQTRPRTFNEILNRLQAVVQANTAAAGEAWELPVVLEAKGSANATDMEDKRTAVQEAKGVYHRRSRRGRNRWPRRASSSVGGGTLSMPRCRRGKRICCSRSMGWIRWIERVLSSGFWFLGFMVLGSGFGFYSRGFGLMIIGLTSKN